MSRTTVGPFVGALLRIAWRAVRDQIDDAVKMAGYRDINRAHISLFRYPTIDGSRPGQLADEMPISKQTVNGLLLDLERRGYIRRVVDSADERRRIIRLTAKGIKLEDTIRLAARDAEMRLEREFGRPWLLALRTALGETTRVLSSKGNSRKGRQP